MLYLHGLGHFHPGNLIDNEFLESLDIGTSAEWIVDRTGIRTRRTVLSLDYIRKTRNRDVRASHEASLHTNAETGCRAAAMALERAGISADRIGMVVAGGSAPTISSPAEACLIADRIGLAVPAVDINSACSTFAVQLRFLAAMDPASLPDFVLVVNPDNLTRAVNYEDRSTAVLMGDCTTAAIVSSRVPSGIQVLDGIHESDPSGWNKVEIPLSGFLRQEGAAVQNFAIRKTMSLLEKLSFASRPEAYFVGHQANLMMLQSVCHRLSIPDHRHLFNVDCRGNCGAAGAPSVISENWDRFAAGDEILTAVVGAGLTWAGLRLRLAPKEA